MVFGVERGCLLFVVCCLLSVVCCCVSCVVVVCRALFSLRCLLFVVCCLLFVDYRVSFVVC